MRPLALWLTLLMAVLALVSCGGSGGGNSGGGTGSATAAILPSAVTVGPGGVVAFAATLPGGDPVWSVEGDGAGTVDAGGRYVAPATPGVYAVVVASRSNPAATARARVTVTDGAAVTVAPLQVSRPAGERVAFTANVTGSSAGVTWSVVEPGGGAISPTGDYTAPETPGVYTVRATLVGRPDAYSEARVSVTAPLAVTISGAPSPAITTRKGKLYLSARVANADAGSDGVAWTTSAGTITTGGLLTPPDAEGDLTVTAASVQNPLRTATLTVRVVANPKVTFTFRDRGAVALRLDTTAAPITSGNLVELANRGFYEGIVLHRYEPDFVVQWGDPLTKTLPLTDPSIGTGGPGYTIPFETNPLKHLKYALGMARGTARDSGGSQIYVCLKDLPDLDGNYVVFGRVEAGFAVVDALRRGDVVQSAVVEP